MTGATKKFHGKQYALVGKDERGYFCQFHPDEAGFRQGVIKLLDGKTNTDLKAVYRQVNSKAADRIDNAIKRLNKNEEVDLATLLA
ncbi:MAG: hypothetical protein ABIH92_03445 [Nanoarchaeota archaeon]